MSSPETPALFVCGATGSQGGSLAHHLRNTLNWEVHATVRNLTAPGTQSLREAGVHHLTQLEDWEESSNTLAAAMAGCTKLFLCLLPDFSDPDRERRQAEHIVRIAKVAGVTQVVASTSLGVFTLEHERETVHGATMAGHLASKKAVEDVVRSAGFAHWTILRPSFMMANFLEPKVARYPEPRDHGTWTTALTAEAPLALVDHADIAVYAAMAFQQPERFHGRVVGMASELLTVQETLDLLGQAAGGRTMTAVFLTDDEIVEKQKTSNVFTNSQVSMRTAYRYIDMEAMRAVIGRPTTFRRFLEREREAVESTYSSVLSPPGSSFLG